MSTRSSSGQENFRMANPSVSSQPLGGKSRKFKHAIGGLGFARHNREVVSQTIKENSLKVVFVVICLLLVICLFRTQAKPDLVAPIDYEAFLTHNRSVIDAHRHRDMLLFPDDDISISSQKVATRTAVSSVIDLSIEDIEQPLARHCIETFTSDWQLVTFNYVKCQKLWAFQSNTSVADVGAVVYEVDIADAEGTDEVGYPQISSIWCSALSVLVMC
ncbi:unnamed protein product [Soboliphyme baturini]|uniref:DUF3398 domain-containing protein n=1 Tax=Soboliphyme baturini TaxID=241478 RepID=A0A183J0Y1_9BILA|nr:unnamed protein product [Soboliphyme baturini]